MYAQAQQQLQAKSDECIKVHKQLEGQTCVINTIEEELRAVRLEFAAIENKVAHNESHGKGMLVVVRMPGNTKEFAQGMQWLFCYLTESLPSCSGQPSVQGPDTCCQREQDARLVMCVLPLFVPPSFPPHLITSSHHPLGQVCKAEHAGIKAVQLAEQLKSRADNQACLNHLIAKLEKDLQCKEAALQTATEEVKARLIQLPCDRNLVISTLVMSCSNSMLKSKPVHCIIAHSMSKTKACIAHHV